MELRDRLSGAESAAGVLLSQHSFLLCSSRGKYRKGDRTVPRLGTAAPCSAVRLLKDPTADPCSDPAALGISGPRETSEPWFRLSSAGSNHLLSLYLHFSARLPGTDSAALLGGGAWQRPRQVQGTRRLQDPRLKGCVFHRGRALGCDVWLGREQGSWSGLYHGAAGAACAPAPAAKAFPRPCGIDRLGHRPETF